jgi:hypothetical protein
MRTIDEYLTSEINQKYYKNQCIYKPFQFTRNIRNIHEFYHLKTTTNVRNIHGYISSYECK